MYGTTGSDYRSLGFNKEHSEILITLESNFRSGKRRKYIEN